jgi:hypothetical protein
MGAGFHALATEYAALFLEPEFPVVIKREHFTGTDADARPAVDTLALVKTYPVIEDPDLCPEAGHRRAHELALVVRDFDERLAFR